MTSKNTFSNKKNIVFYFFFVFCFLFVLWRAPQFHGQSGALPWTKSTLAEEAETSELKRLPTVTEMRYEAADGGADEDEDDEKQLEISDAKRNAESETCGALAESRARAKAVADENMIGQRLNLDANTVADAVAGARLIQTDVFSMKKNIQKIK